jgi:hypothetical protein
MSIDRIVRANHSTEPGYIKDRTPFDANTMKARWYGPSMRPSIGELDAFNRGQLWEHKEDALRMYVVFSYDTPIAWYTEERGWFIVHQHFSRTTSKHQSRLYLIEQGSH